MRNFVSSEFGMFHSLFARPYPFSNNIFPSRATRTVPLNLSRSTRPFISEFARAGKPPCAFAVGPARHRVSRNAVIATPQSFKRVFFDTILAIVLVVLDEPLFALHSRGK